MEGTPPLVQWPQRGGIMLRVLDTDSLSCGIGNTPCFKVHLDYKWKNLIYTTKSPSLVGEWLEISLDQRSGKCHFLPSFHILRVTWGTELGSTYEFQTCSRQFPGPHLHWLVSGRAQATAALRHRASHHWPVERRPWPQEHCGCPPSSCGGGTFLKWVILGFWTAAIPWTWTRSQ